MEIPIKAKHELVDIDNDNREIFRVMEISRLLDLFETEEISLTAPKLWDDSYEDFLRYSHGISNENTNTQISFEGHSKYIFGQCWTLNEETDAIWRIYSPNKNRVKIKTTISKLHERIKKIQDNWFLSYIGTVKYRPESEIRKNISDGIKNHREHFVDKKTLISEYYLSKRDIFAHENEIRLLVCLPHPPENFHNAIYQDPDNLDICNLPIEDPLGLIDEVVFDPRMPNSLVNAYTSHLRNSFQYNKAMLKSDIYSMPIIKENVSQKYLW